MILLRVSNLLQKDSWYLKAKDDKCFSYDHARSIKPIISQAVFSSDGVCHFKSDYDPSENKISTTPADYEMTTDTNNFQS